MLAGGYGGAKMAHGFALLGSAIELSVVVNTGDDLELHGLHVSPDLDTVMYTLAGLSNPETGWGVREETWSTEAMLQRYGEQTWFRLGDRDLATHIVRSARLRRGLRLTEVTAQLAEALGVDVRLLPMSDDSVRTKIRTADGWLDFQDYFVRRRHRDDVLELRFHGVDAARPTTEVEDAVRAAELVVVAPSNPFVSIGPILALPGMTEMLLAAGAPTVAVSPIVGGAALRGPADKMMRSAGLEATSAGVARLYTQRHPGLIDMLVIDEHDKQEAGRIRETGIEPLVLRAVMRDDDDRRRLAAEMLDLVRLPAR